MAIGLLVCKIKEEIEKLHISNMYVHVHDLYFSGIDPPILILLRLAPTFFESKFYCKMFLLMHLNR